MKDPQGKKKLATSSAAIISIGIHVALIVAAGSWVAFKFITSSGINIQVEEQKKLERRKLRMPVKQEPFIEQMSKPKSQSTTRITANTPQLVNIPESGEYIRLAPVQTFAEAYTNFVSMDRTLEFNSKYRRTEFGISEVDFYGTKGKTEKAAIIIDVSMSMLFDELGGPASYQMVREDLAAIIENMRSATLLNLIVFDGQKISLFKPRLTPATPSVRSEMLEWFGTFNTNLMQVGISDDMNNYIPQKTYSIPMAADDVYGWLKGYQAAIEQQPDMIFLLSSQWGSVTTMKENISYFLNSAQNDQFQKERAEYFLSEKQEEMEEFTTQFGHLRSAALKMLELENEARIAAEMSPKVVRDWDEILYNNDVEMPPPPVPKKMDSIKTSVTETRYTMAEVLETLFAMTVDNYGAKGFPQLNFVMLKAKNFATQSENKAAMMTSDQKFKQLAKMCRAKLRYLDGMPSVDNLLSQKLSDVEALIGSGN